LIPNGVGFVISGARGNGMENLLHWNYVEKFSGIEAASLIVGIDPSNIHNEKGKITPVMQRMMSDYDGALSAATWAYDFNDGAKGKLPDPEEYPNHLYSYRMFHSSGFEYNFVELSKGHWLKDREQTIFEHQKFSRDELARWISVPGMSSVYKFKVDTNGQNPSSTRWPWGDHQTELLGHLEAAARRYWINYDPSDPTTAPTNKTVIEWLKKERKVSSAKAEAIASMLRADGLPTGPRK